jgi:multimeric flavodoxin WrbA
MKYGIFVYSETGHTLSVVKLLKKELESLGNEVKVITLEACNTKSNRKLKFVPEAVGYDHIIFASPVQGFSLSQTMSEFLTKVQMPIKQKVSLLITQHLKKAWLGGTRSLRQMKKLLLAHEAILMNEYDVHWSSKDRENQIQEALKVLCS